MKSSALVLILLTAVLNLNSTAHASDDEAWAGSLTSSAKSAVRYAKQKIALTSNCKGLVEILKLGADRSENTDGSGELRNSSGASDSYSAEQSTAEQAQVDEVTQIRDTINYLKTIDSAMDTEKGRKKMERLWADLNRALRKRVAELSKKKYCHGIERVADEASEGGGGEGGGIER